MIPVIALVIQPETIQTNETLKATYDFLLAFGINTPSRFLIALCVVMIGAFLFKGHSGFGQPVPNQIFLFRRASLVRPNVDLSFFPVSRADAGTDSGRILAEINGWPLQFANTFMVGGLMMVNEISVISIIAIGLLFYNPVVFLSIAILIGLGALIIRRATKNRLLAYSDIRRHIEPHTNTLINNAVRGLLKSSRSEHSDAVREAYLKDRWTIFRLTSNTALRSQPHTGETL